MNLAFVLAQALRITTTACSDHLMANLPELQKGRSDSNGAQIAVRGYHSATQEQNTKLLNPSGIGRNHLLQCAQGTHDPHAEGVRESYVTALSTSHLTPSSLCTARSGSHV